MYDNDKIDKTSKATYFP